jgi:small-conductance mechanosensitive channel
MATISVQNLITGPGLYVWLLQPDFWRTLTSEIVSNKTLWLAFLVVLISGLLLRHASHERSHIRAALLLFALYIICIPVVAFLESFSYASAADYTRLIGKILLIISLINLGSLFLFDVLLSAAHLLVPRILRDTTMLFAYAVAGLWLLSSRGVDLRGIIATSAILTAVIGLSLQDTLGNIMAGLALQMEHLIQVGDFVKIDQHIGKVKEIRWRQTTIETRNWDTVVVPNSTLMKGEVVIYGRRQNEPLQSRRWIYFNVDFSYSPTEVIERVNEALRSAPIENIADNPQINTILMDFKDSYCQYAVRYWLTDLAVDDPTDSIVRVRIYYALKRASIPFSIPSQERRIVRETRKRHAREKKQEMESRLEALHRVELFNTMTEEELLSLASCLRYAPFSRGEVLTHQGAEAHWLYIITNGRVAVRVSLNGTIEKEVAQLQAGKFFGEMSLMTGERRSATVIALEDVECYRLDKDAFQGILSARPEIAEDISSILAKRRVELEAVVDGLDVESNQSRMDATQSHILGLIRNFFKI